jgi:Relaxase/Mobilisation nuclease domain.
MIIKSMSRKVPSFGQLIGYIDREGMPEQYRIRHHLFGWDAEEICVEFERNAALLQKRRNGVYLYHEILSITRAAGLDPEEQKARLMEIVQAYIAARCPDNLVYGGLHQDKDHSLHFHLMISSNRADDTKRLRLDKRQFREIQVRLEEHVLKRYPELEQKLAIGKRSDRKLNQAEVERERRTGERPARQTVLERVREALAGARDRDSLRDALGRSDLELYVRGKNLGVIDLETGKKHRLNTLDPELMPAFEARLLKVEAEPEERKPEEAREQAKTSERHHDAEAPKKAGAGQNEKAPDRVQEPEPKMTSAPQTPSPERKEQIERDEVEPDPSRDKMSHEDWAKRDTFSHKFAASWKRSISELRGKQQEKDRDRDDEPER